MKFFLVLALVGAASAGLLKNNYLPPLSAASSGGSGLQAPYPAARSQAAPAAILAYSNENNGDGAYQYSFETENGIKTQESGTAGESSSVSGSYSYTAPDGQLITVNWVSDVNGYRAEGAHLPTSPPIPEAILKSLAFNAAEEKAAAASTNTGYPSGRPNNAYLPPV